MKTETREYTTVTTVYVAEDGAEFNTENECVFYEWRLHAPAVWAVSRRGARTELAEVYTTEELAIKACENNANYLITKRYLDERHAIISLQRN